MPEIAQSNITPRWLRHAEFDHRAHRMMSCTACHSRTSESHDTSDILLLGSRPAANAIEQPIHQEKLRGRCFECHQYHDWSQAKRTKGRFSIPELRERPALLRQETKGNRNPVFSENSQRIASHPQPAYSVGRQSHYTTHHPEGTCVPFLAD